MSETGNTPGGEMLTPTGSPSLLPKQVWTVGFVVSVIVVGITVPWSKMGEIVKPHLPSWMSSRVDEDASTKHALAYIEIAVSRTYPIREVSVPLSMDKPTQWIRIVGSSHETIWVDPPTGFTILPEKGPPIRIDADTSRNKERVGQVLKRPFRLLGNEVGQSATLTAFQ